MILSTAWVLLMYEILLKGPKPIVSAVNQGTQTDGVYEINSMKKEGLKFLVSRVFNYETHRATENHKMCSIADDHFFLNPADEKDELEDKPSAYNEPEDIYKDEDKYEDSYEDDDESDGSNDAAVLMPRYSCRDTHSDGTHELNDPSYKALDYLRTIQEKDKKYRDKWEENATVLKSEEPTLSLENSTTVDKMTQYGDENPDEDFFKGAMFMAKKILEHESRRRDIEIDDFHWEDRELCDFECPTGCKGECLKEFCDRCEETGCKCDCEPGKKTECDCGPDSDDSDSESYEYDPDDCDCYSKECDCDKCKCAEIKRLCGDNYRKYQIWNSQTPSDLVKELMRKIHDVRWYKAFLETPSKYEPGGYGWASIGW